MLYHRVFLHYLCRPHTVVLMGVVFVFKQTFWYYSYLRSKLIQIKNGFVIFCLQFRFCTIDTLILFDSVANLWYSTKLQFLMRYGRNFHFLIQICFIFRILAINNCVIKRLISCLFQLHAWYWQSGGLLSIINLIIFKLIIIRMPFCVVKLSNLEILTFSSSFMKEVKC